MKMMFNVFSKKLFGAKYERLTRTMLIYLIVFWGLYISNFQVRIAPFYRGRREAIHYLNRAILWR